MKNKGLRGIGLLVLSGSVLLLLFCYSSYRSSCYTCMSFYPIDSLTEQDGRHRITICQPDGSRIALRCTPEEYALADAHREGIFRIEYHWSAWFPTKGRILRMNYDKELTEGMRYTSSLPLGFYVVCFAS